MSSLYLETWFARKGWQPFPFQREAWAAYLRGESGLIHAATGTGKTLAAWLGPVAEWLAENNSQQAETPKSKIQNPKSLRVVWLTPLRALAADTLEALRLPLAELGVPWTLETRTGDTAAATRARQRKHLPNALITTPESLTLLLARDDAPELFRDLRAVIVDEWHELLASKRGVQTELALAHLRTFAPGLRTWGLSATLGNLDLALTALTGVHHNQGPSPQPPAPSLIQGEVPKTLIIDALIPTEIERFPWAGHLGLRMLPQVVAAIEEGRSALVFTNTRAQTEIWYQAILDTRPDWAGEIALHHGSLGRDVRDWVERALKEGTVRCVVCTSSLDLGVDFAPVDRVLQIGSPKGVARLLQRAGRSGHSPGRPSRVTCVPTNAFELIEVAAVRRAVAEGHIEARSPLQKPLDVLVQHLVTCALGGGFVADALLAEVRTTYAYRDLTDDEWQWAIDFVTSGGAALGNYPEYRRVVVREDRYVVEDKQIARRHRQSIGTIVSEAALSVQFLRGGRLGSVEESFVSRLKAGDRFVFAGRTLEFVRLRDMTVWVRLASSVKGTVRCVVCTSSLDLGVDFAPVDRVLQIGSPKGVARLLQRAGRSGHSPGRPSRVTCVPTNAFELIEVAAVRRAVAAGHIEARPPLQNPLDVLVQHLVTCALGGGFVADALLAEVRTTYAYRDLTDDEWQWAIDFVTSGGAALGNYPEDRRVVVREDRYVVEDKQIARRHRQSIGTIVSEAALSVQFLRGGRLGSVEESFVSRLKAGDRFVFAGRTLEFVRLRDMTVWVRLASSVKGTVPRWSGSRMPLSTELAAAVRATLEQAAEGVFDQPELEAVRPILAIQNRWSAIPRMGELLIEQLKTREGHHLFFYPFEGRSVHEGLAALFAYRLSQLQPISFTIAVNDYGFELLSPDPISLESIVSLQQTTDHGLLTTHNLAHDITAALNATEMARRQFREIARVAGLVYQGFPGEKNARQLQASSGLIYDVFQQYDPANRLLDQATREVLDRQLEQSRLARALERLSGTQLLVREVKRPTPFAFPLIVDRMRETLSSEKLADRVRKMTLQLEKAAG